MISYTKTYPTKLHIFYTQLKFPLCGCQKAHISGHKVVFNERSVYMLSHSGCLTPWTHMDCSLPVQTVASSVHGIFQARILSCCHFLLKDIFPTQGSNLRLFSLLQQRVDSIGLVLLGVFPGGSASKESTCNVGDLGSIPGLGRSPGEGKGYPLQYSGLENPMDCIIHGVAKSWV